jgi:predicted dehydrogenase
MAKVGIGVIGLGRMGRVYAYHTARQIEGAAVAAVADSNPQALNEFAAQVPGVLTFTDYHDLLASPHEEGVIIASPTSTHPDVAIAAAQAGKAIFCEKPVALTLQGTDRQATQSRGAPDYAPFDRGYAEAKRKIDAGGRPAGDDPLYGRDPLHQPGIANPAVSGGLIVTWRSTILTASAG